MVDDRSLLTVAQAARMLERSTEQVRRYLREQRLPGQRIGGQWFIERDQLRQFAEIARERTTFVAHLGTARALSPLDGVIATAGRHGTDISRGKQAFLRRAASR